MELYVNINDGGVIIADTAFVEVNVEYVYIFFVDFKKTSATN